MSAARHAAIVALAVASFLAPSFARAQGGDMHEQARAHYDMGTGAYVRADYKTAAQEFALADAMSPSGVALSAALDAAIQADLAPLVMELADRSRRGTVDAALGALVAKARTRFSKRVGRVHITCAAPCTAKVDGVVVDPSREHYALVGKHTVTLDRAAGSTDRAIEILPDARTEVGDPTPTARSAEGPPTQASQGVLRAFGPQDDRGKTTPTPNGLTPAVFFTGIGLTAVLGAVTVISGVDTSHKHDDYFTAHCDTKSVNAPCSSLSSDGISAQHRTNILIGVTSAIAVTTAVVGVFFTRWRSGVSAQVVGSAATAQLRIAWP